MKCNKCGNEINIQLAANVRNKGAKVLTQMTTIVTVQCEKCSSVFQLPLQGKSIMSVQKDKE